MMPRSEQRQVRSGGWLTVLALFGLILATPAQGQERFEVKGVVLDSAGSRVANAMVVALIRADSAIKTFATTTGSGAFQLPKLPTGEYILQVTAIGFAPLRQNFAVSDRLVDLGTVTLQAASVTLTEIVVNAEHIPIVNRRDTLEFNALAFATRPMAVVEDLLRLLPGVVVEADGKITAQGQAVGKVLVDGKEFFGTDPTVATRNLPAGAVSKVQVFDKQSDMAEFTGILDGQEQKAINLVLKDDAKVGYFGRTAGGLGSDVQEQPVGSLAGADRTRYSGSASLNRFTPTAQLAGIANFNNINQPGFAWSDFQTFIGGARGMAAGGMDGVPLGGGRDDGLTETLGLGLNAAYDFASRSWIRGSYFVSNLDNRQDAISQQQQLQGGSVLGVKNSTSSATTATLSHKLNLNAQRTFAEGHDLRVRADLQLATSTLGSQSFQETRTGAGQLQNLAATDLAVDGNNPGGAATLTWRKRLSGTGRTLVGEFRANLNSPELNSRLSSSTDLTDANGGVATVDLLQDQRNSGQTFSHSGRLSMTQPLGSSGKGLELFGQYSAVNEDQTRVVYDLGSGAPVLNPVLSSAYERTYSYLRGGFRLSSNASATRWTLGLQGQRSNLNGTIANQGATISNGFSHILPTANVRFQLATGTTMDVSYNTSTREPAMTELQPFVDNTNPLYVYSGNPGLVSEYAHSVRGTFRKFDQFTFTNLMFNFAAGYTVDDIITSRTVEAGGKQQVTRLNATQGMWTASGGASYGRPVRPIGARLNLDYGLSYSTGLEYVNENENASRIVRHSMNVTLDNRNKENMDLRAGARLMYTMPDYDLNPALGADYWTNTWYGSGTYFIGSNWTIAGSGEYRTFDQQLFGPSESVAVLGGSIGYMVMGGRGELQLISADLLNQNTGVSVTSNANAIEERRIDSLGRHVMVRFTYRLGGGMGSGTVH
mgnify:CR=1 FL=1